MKIPVLVSFKAAVIDHFNQNDEELYEQVVGFINQLDDDLDSIGYTPSAELEEVAEAISDKLEEIAEAEEEAEEEEQERLEEKIALQEVDEDDDEDDEEVE